MIPVFNSYPRCLVLALLFAVLTAEEAMAKTGRSANRETATEESSAGADATLDLAGQVSEIAHSNAISRTKKEKRISTAVRIALVSATAYKTDPKEIVGIALELTEAASRAAPSFAEVIANAAAFTPSLGRIDAAVGQIRTAAFSAAKNPKAMPKRNVARARSRPTEETPEPVRSSPRTKRAPAPAPVEEPEPETTVRESVADASLPEEASSGRKIPLERKTNFSVTADVSVRRDDNVYLSSTNKVSDTIIAVTPGIEFLFGQNSLAHGSFRYKNALTRYVDKTSENVALSDGAANFGYDNGNLTVMANAFFQQLNQNNNAVSGLPQNAIFRRDLLGVDASVESHLTAKTSVLTGVNYNKSEYKNGGLNGSQETTVPLKFYLATTPKVSVSTGLAYRRVVPQNGGPSGRDMDYNVGARGNFTAKLNGEFSLNYRTRAVGANPTEKLWGLNGNLSYEITPKTSSSLVFSRDFTTGALGESLKNTTLALRFASDPTPQWQLGAGLAFRRTEYGPYVFRINNVLTPVDRTDTSWDADLQATYLWRSWLSTTASYTLRHNSSTLPGAEYNNSILSLILGCRY